MAARPDAKAHPGPAPDHRTPGAATVVGRIADHETLEGRFERLTSAINDRMNEFDDRILRMNETRAGSITLQLQETIRAIKRYPDALQQVHLGISNAEARIGIVEQTATHRIEVIRAEMSWALHDHKERTDRLIDQLSPESLI